MDIIDKIRLVANKRISKIRPYYDMTGKRFIYCNGELVSYREIMKLKRMYQHIALVAVLVLLFCYAYIAKLLLV